MKGVVEQGRMLVLSVAVMALTLVLGAAATSSRSAAAAGPAAACDPALELCLLDEAPWVSPQEIFYEGPLSVDSLEVELRQGSKRTQADKGEVDSEEGVTRTWRVVVPAKLKNRDVKIIATTDEPGIEHRAEGRVRPATKKKTLKITKSGNRRTAKLRVGLRGQVRATVQMKLTARYPAEKSKKLNSWKVKKQLKPKTGKVRIKTGNVERRCNKYATCKLRATAKIKSFGYKLGGRSKKARVPTSPERFSGSLGFVPGNASSGGGGRRYNYAIYVERGIKIDRKDFAKAVGKTLGDRRGWTRTGRVSFRQVSSASSANTRVILASPALVDRLCAPLATRGYVSCTKGSTVVLNLNRWRYAVPHFSSRLTYRRMLVNHEMGHRIGHGHRNCSGRGNKAPVMQQQTYGLQGCKANAWPLGSEAASARAGSGSDSRERSGWLD